MKAALTSLHKRVTRMLRPARIPPALGRLIRHNQARWPQRAASDGAVVMVSQFSDRASIWCNAYVVNALADHHGAGLMSFYFAGPPDPLVGRMYESFGAPLGLSLADAEPFRDQAAAEAEKIFAGLRTKSDVVRIAVDGLCIGDLIYDTYLRYLARATVELHDPELHRHLFEALLIYYASRAFLARQRLAALVVDHLVYSNCGILLRLAFQAGVPVYQIYFGDRFFPYCLSDHQRPDEVLSPVRWPYWRFPQLFATLSEKSREEARGRARAALEARFSGAVDHGILRAQSAYEEAGAERIFPDSDQPRILIFLHDFCDAVHVYRDVLFPDFREWITFLLERATETPFAWYVKPHPNTRDPARAAMNRTNDAVTAQLRERFPKITFLPPSTSNRQLLAEGVCALFTVYGTCGHEFAWHGVPVVNAGDNPHIAYRFNLHPQTLEEYARCIREADRLEVPIARRDIEEYFYVNYLHFPAHWSTDAHPIDPAVLKHPDWLAMCGRPEIFDAFRHGATPEREACLRAYFQDYSAGSTQRGSMHTPPPAFSR